MDDRSTMRFAPPGVSRYTPKNDEILDCNGVAHLLGVSRRTLERALVAPGPKSHGPSKSAQATSAFGCAATLSPTARRWPS